MMETMVIYFEYNGYILGVQWLYTWSTMVIYLEYNVQWLYNYTWSTMVIYLEYSSAYIILTAATSLLSPSVEGYIF